MLSITVPLGSHLELIGLAAARMEVRAFSWDGLVDPIVFGKEGEYSPGVPRAADLADDAGLGDGEGLLLHHLVQHRPCALVHLVELVDAADAVVGEHQGAGLEHQLPRLGVPGNNLSKTSLTKTKTNTNTIIISLRPDLVT